MGMSAPQAAQITRLSPEGRELLRASGYTPAELQTIDGYGHTSTPLIGEAGSIRLSPHGEAVLRRYGCGDEDISDIRLDTGEDPSDPDESRVVAIKTARKRQTTAAWKAKNPSKQAEYQRAYRQRQKQSGNRHAVQAHGKAPRSAQEN